MLIHTIMLVSLGFLSASLLAMILAPFLWGRAVRLTTERIKGSMPMTLAEMQADKDQLRADFAIKIRQFEVDLEHTNIKAARQLIELSRRETDISKLKVDIGKISTELEEQHNANNVMRQTITTRIPQLEAKLHKAKEMLGARFQEIGRLRTTISQQEGQLGEVRSVEQQRLAEIQRLKSTLENQEHAKIAQEEYEKLKARNEALIAEVHQLKNQLLKAHKNAETEAKALKQQMHVLSDRLMGLSKTQPKAPQGSQKEPLPAQSQMKQNTQETKSNMQGGLSSSNFSGSYFSGAQSRDQHETPPKALSGQAGQAKPPVTDKDKPLYPHHLKPVQETKPVSGGTMSGDTVSGGLVTDTKSHETIKTVKDEKPVHSMSHSSTAQSHIGQPQAVQPHTGTKPRLKDDLAEDMHPAFLAQSND